MRKKIIAAAVSSVAAGRKERRMSKTEIAAWLLAGALTGMLGIEKRPEPILATPDKPVVYIAEQTAPEKEPPVKGTPNEPWFGTDRKLTAYEWDIFGQVIMAEARGESFEVQYYVACTILNRVDSPLFPDTLAGVIYQTEPAVQFYGAWDTEQYEVSDFVLEAVQEALIHNNLPADVYYFTSEGYLPGTEGWEHIGNMWFSRQEQ